MRFLMLTLLLFLCAPLIAAAQSDAPSAAPGWTFDAVEPGDLASHEAARWQGLDALPERPPQVFWIRALLVGVEPDAAFDNPVMRVEAAGGYEVYLDGRLIARGGAIGRSDRAGQAAPEIAHFGVPAGLLRPETQTLLVRADARMLAADQAFRFTFQMQNAADVARQARVRDRIDGAAGFGALFLTGAFLALYAWRRARRDMVLAALMCACVFAIVLINPEARSFGASVAAERWVSILLALFSVALFVLVPSLIYARLRLSRAKVWIVVVAAAFLLSLIPVGGVEQDARAFAALMTVTAFMSLTAWTERPREAGLHALGAAMALLAILIEPDYLTTFLAVGMALLSLSLIADVMMGEWRARQRDARIARLSSDLVKRNIQPHFIMNSLTVAGELQETEPETARAFIAAMAAEFAALAAIIDEPRVRLRQELELCRSHLAMMGLRLGLEFLLEVNVPDPEAEFPPGVLHTLLENAISHNRYAGVVTFRLDGAVDGRTYRYVLTVPLGRSMPSSGVSSGTGARYVETRLEEFSPGRWSIDAIEREEAWVTVMSWRGHRP